MAFDRTALQVVESGARIVEGDVVDVHRFVGIVIEDEAEMRVRVDDVFVSEVCTVWRDAFPFVVVESQISVAVASQGQDAASIGVALIDRHSVSSDTV